MEANTSIWTNQKKPKFGSLNHIIKTPGKKIENGSEVRIKL